MSQAKNVYDQEKVPKEAEEETKEKKEESKAPIKSNDLMKKILSSLKQNKKMMLYTTFMNSKAVNTLEFDKIREMLSELCATDGAKRKALSLEPTADPAVRNSADAAIRLIYNSHVR